MYGFLRAHQCQLTKDDKDIYKKMYCGHCATLQDLFGYKYRALVSYDSVFLGLLFSSQNTEKESKDKKWCAIFPKKINVVSPKEKVQIFTASIEGVPNV